jgi:polyphosphate glucokinase
MKHVPLPGPVLVVDVGGSHVKCLVSGQTEPRQFDSWSEMSAAQMVDRVFALVKDWTFDRVSVGFPGAVTGNRPATEPHNLGHGWQGFDFEAAFQRPTLVINDSALQAYGAYRGGKMLFLGLGTGLGTTMIADDVIIPMELAHLPYKNDSTYEDRVGKRGLEKSGETQWRREVDEIVKLFRRALLPDYIVLGGGNARRIKDSPPYVSLVSNHAAFYGGIRLWDPTRHQPRGESRRGAGQPNEFIKESNLE